MRSLLVPHLTTRRRRNGAGGFVARFTVFVVLASIAYSLFERHADSATSATAALVSGIGTRLGWTAVAVDNVVWTERRFSFAVIPECLPVAPALFFVAAVLAYPAAGRQRVVGIAVGVPAIAAFGLVRLLAMMGIGIHHRSWFDPVHGFWFETLLLFGTGVGWLAWAQWATDGAPRRARKQPGDTRRAVARFAVVYSACAVAGMLGLARAYGELVHAVSWLTGGFLWSGTVNLSVSPRLLSFLYGAPVAVVALIVATPRAGRAQRWEAVVRGVLILFVLHVATVLVVAALDVNDITGSLRVSVMSAMGIASSAFPLGYWMNWARRTRLRHLPRWTRQRRGPVAATTEPEAPARELVASRPG